MEVLLTCSYSFICSATWRLVQVLSMATTVRAHLDRQRQGKVEVNMKAMGSAPALRQPRFTIDGTKKFSKLTSYLKDSGWIGDRHFRHFPNLSLGDRGRARP